jgi:hypothetical protein
MEEIGWEAEIGHGLQDDRDEGHVLGPGRYAEQSRLGDRAAEHVILVPIRVRSALMPVSISRPVPPATVLRSLLSPNGSQL